MKEFITSYNKAFGETVDINEKPSFARMSSMTAAIKNPWAIQFMEMKYAEYFKFKTVKMKRLRDAKRWYEICCSCLYSERWDECEVVITFQGVGEIMDGAISDFLLFTS